MAILFPDEKIARLWQGALEASLKQAPLEEFLRVRAIKVAARGPARHSDNISRATLFLMAATLEEPISEGRHVSPSQYAFVGRATCCVCEGLAVLIGQPRSWRVAALVSTTQLMPRSLVLLDAAKRGALAVRQFASLSQSLSADFREISLMASAAVIGNTDALLQQFRLHIRSRIDNAAGLSSITAASNSKSDGVHLRVHRQ